MQFKFRKRLQVCVCVFQAFSYSWGGATEPTNSAITSLSLCQGWHRRGSRSSQIQTLLIASCDKWRGQCGEIITSHVAHVNRCGARLVPPQMRMFKQWGVFHTRLSLCGIAHSLHTDDDECKEKSTNCKCSVNIHRRGSLTGNEWNSTGFCIPSVSPTCMKSSFWGLSFWFIHCIIIQHFYYFNGLCSMKHTVTLFWKVRATAQ